MDKPKMTIIAISDIHGNIENIDKLSSELEDTDLLLLVGDITHFGTEKDVHNIIHKIKGHTKDILAVPGNCDYPQVNEYLMKAGIGLHAQNIIKNGIAFIGIGGSLPCPCKTPNEFNEEEFNILLNRAETGIPGETSKILFTHQPPYNTKNDRIANGNHVGSASIRAYIENNKPLICFTGHIHEGIGVDFIEETVIVNPGPFRFGRYVFAEVDSSVKTVEIREI
jgi:Icc-related predicted phosphoesterase